MDQVRILHIGIAVPFATAYAYAHRPEHFPEWAAGMATSLHETADGWVAETPAGAARVTFSPPNDYGVLDHRVAIAGRPEIVVPLRLIAHGDTTLAELVLFRQLDMTDAGFDHDTALVEKDLAALKKRLEDGR